MLLVGGHAVKGLLLAFFVLAAGCLGGPADPAAKNDEAFPDLPLPDVNLPLTQFSGCYSGVMGLQVPWPTARLVVPSEFTLQGPTGATAVVLVEVLRCDRVANDTQVLESVHFMWSYVFVEPVNESWTEPHFPNRYVVEVVTDSEDLRSYFEGLGTLAHAGTFQHTRPPKVDAYGGEAWLVTTKDFTVSTASGGFDLPPQDHPHEFAGHFWFGEGPFQRISENKEGEVDAEITFQTGSVTVAGLSRLGRAMGSPMTPHAISGTVEPLTLEMQLDGSWSS